MIDIKKKYDWKRWREWWVVKCDKRYVRKKYNFIIVYIKWVEREHLELKSWLFLFKLDFVRSIYNIISNLSLNKYLKMIF